MLPIGACRVYVTVTEPLPVDRRGDSRAAASPADARSKTAGYLGREDTDYFRLRVESTSYVEAPSAQLKSGLDTIPVRW